MCPVSRPMNLILDIGNTFMKAALYDGRQCLERQKWDRGDFAALRGFALGHRPAACAFATVCTGAEEVREALMGIVESPLEVTGLTPTPLSIGYETPAKLGADRLAAAVGAAALKPDCELIVIDAGSCMTIDRVTAGGLYLGGNISPGLEMRLKAMHTLTARLPLVGIDGATPQWGRNTAEALRSGTLTGIRGEADSYLRRFFAEQAGGNAYAFLTGGDACRLDTLPYGGGAIIEPRLVEIGLAEILRYNVAPNLERSFG